MIARALCRSGESYLALGAFILVLLSSCHSSDLNRRDAGLSRSNDADAGDAGSGGLEHAISSDVDIFDPAVVRQYEVTVDPDDWDRIRHFPVREQYIAGKLTVGHKTYEPIALRFKGARGSLYGCFSCCSTSDTLEMCPGPDQACYDDNGMVGDNRCAKLSMKLDFSNDWGKAHFFDLDRLNLHAPTPDGTAGIRERLAYWMFRDFGVVAPRAASIVLSVNGEDLGIYTIVEAPSDSFVRSQFGEADPGNLIKQRWPTLSTDPGYFESGLENHTKQPDVSHMVELAEALQTASDSDVESVLREHLDLDAMLRFLAVDRAIVNFDGPLAFRCKDHTTIPALPPDVLAAQEFPLPWETCQNKNYYFYERASDHRQVLVPWDLNATLFPFPAAAAHAWTDAPEACDQLQWNGRSPQCDPLVRWLATVLYPQYLSAGQQLLATTLQLDRVNDLVDAWAMALAPVALEHEPMLNADQFTNGITYLKQNLQDLRTGYESAVSDDH